MDFDFASIDFGTEEFNFSLFPEVSLPEGTNMPATQQDFPSFENMSDGIPSCSQIFDETTTPVGVSNSEEKTNMPPTQADPPCDNISDLAPSCSKEIEEETNPTEYVNPSGNINDLTDSWLKELLGVIDQPAVPETEEATGISASTRPISLSPESSSSGVSSDFGGIDQPAVPETEEATEISASARPISLSPENSSSGVSSDFDDDQSAPIVNTAKKIRLMDPRKVTFKVVAGKRKLYKAESFKCPKCEYSSLFKDELRRHIRRNHTSPIKRQILPHMSYPNATDNDKVKLPNLHQLEALLNLKSTKTDRRNTVQPMYIKIKPIEQSSKPMEQPAEPMEQPAEPVEQPAEPVEQPAEPVEQPAEPVEQPAEPIKKPAEPMRASDPADQEVDQAIESFLSILRKDENGQPAKKVIIFPPTHPSGVVRYFGARNSGASTSSIPSGASTSSIPQNGTGDKKKANRIKVSKCPGCNLAFTSQSHLFHHIAVKHTSVRVPLKVPRGSFSTAYTCTRCTTRFPNYILLIQHMKFGHHFEKLSCTACSFVSPCDLEFISHLDAYPSHSPKRMLTCSTCRFESASQKAMMVHIREHMKMKRIMGNMPPYEKGEVFVYRSKAEIEELRKRPFACETCMFSASTYEEGLTHLRNFHGARRYECANCKASTPSLTGMLKHFNSYGHKPSGRI